VTKGLKKGRNSNHQSMKILTSILAFMRAQGNGNVCFVNKPLFYGFSSSIQWLKRSGHIT